MGGARRQRRLDLVDRVDLDDDPLDPRRHRAPHSLPDIAGDRDMVVLDHRRVPQTHAVVGRAAHAGGVFLEHAQAGNGLAGIEQGRAGAGDLVDIGARHRRDAGQVLDGVERGAFGGQQRARIAPQPHQIGARGHAIALARPAPRSPPSGSSARKNASASGRPATVTASRLSITPVNSASAGNDRCGGDIARLPHILRERRADEGVEIETVEREPRLSHPSPAPDRDRPFQPSRWPSPASHRGSSWRAGAALPRSRCAAPDRAARCRASPSC